jgi:hypothetical protein
MPPAEHGSPRHGTNGGEVGPFRRLLLAAIGLAAGNAAPLVYLICNALRLRAALLEAHMGAPDSALPQAWETFLTYGIFSMLGWVLIGVPIALAFPARVLSRVAWLGRMLIGAALGPLALLLIFVVLFTIQGNLSAFSLAHTEGLWPFSIMVSTVSFLVYAALLRRRLLKSEH